jgi:hypothetical protein
MRAAFDRMTDGMRDAAGTTRGLRAGAALMVLTAGISLTLGRRSGAGRDRA